MGAYVSHASEFYRRILNDSVVDNLFQVSLGIEHISRSDQHLERCVASGGSFLLKSRLPALAVPGHRGVIGKRSLK